jgi:hypothetical protein
MNSKDKQKLKGLLTEYIVAHKMEEEAEKRKDKACEALSKLDDNLSGTYSVDGVQLELTIDSDWGTAGIGLLTSRTVVEL